MFKMSFLERIDRDEILLNSSILSYAAYENDPKAFLETAVELKGIDHQIENIENSTFALEVLRT